ncbi:transglutaminase TgpA family protein [Lysobacter fragariae]
MTIALDPVSRRWALLAAAACIVPLLLQIPFTLAAPIAAACAATLALAWRGPLPSWLRLLLTVLVIGAVLGAAGFRFGRDTGCALLAAMLAIKPAETVRLRDARSLIGFALFAPFATFLLDQGPLSLVLGLAGAAAALAALERFADLESGDTRYAVSIWRRLRSVGYLLAVGLPLALAAFWLFPRLGTPMWGVPDRALGRPGLSDRMSPGQWLDMMTDDSPALRVHFVGRTPPRDAMYWRGPVLWNFDGKDWTQPRWARFTPPASMTASATRWTYDMEVEPTDRRQLVSLDLPAATPSGAAMTLDHGLVAYVPLTALTRWHLQSAPPVRYETDLPATHRQAALALPTGFNPRAIALGLRWRREAGNDDVAIANRALDWIRREFAYTLETPVWGRNAVDEFLFDTKAGFCQHFSSSYVVLMRAAGIPARVVTGYAGGYHNPLGDYWIVRNSDAHAWVEIWLRGRGWVRVDPTAAVAPERIFDTLADRTPGAEGLLGGFGTPMWNVRDWMRRGWNDLVLGFDASRQQRLLQPFGIDQVTGQQLGALFGATAGLALLWMVWLSARGQREADPVLRAWRRLGSRYRRFGLEREPFEPARDWTDRVARTRPDLAPALDRLSQRFVEWRYAQLQHGAPDGRASRELIKALRRHRPTPAGGRP